MTRQPSALEGTVIITDHQTKGRGQRGNTWMAEPGKNLTFSLILRPAFVSPQDQFFLTRIISLAVYDLLKMLVDKSVFIKWPNDLLVDHRKVCGILIENQVRGNAIVHSIVGIGLNVNQEHFALPSATSLARIANRTFELPLVLENLLENIEARYLALKSGRLAELEKAYLDALYRRNEQHTFFDGVNEFRGVITGVDSAGKVLIEGESGPRAFDIKEIVYR